MKRNQFIYKVKMAFRFIKEVKNPVSSFMYYFGLKNEVTVKTKRIGHISLNSNQKHLLYSLFLTLHYVKDEDIAEYKNVFNQLLNNNPVIKLKEYDVVHEGSDIFLERYAEYPYNFKNVSEDGIIIDIGSNVGDTALDFAYEGLTVYGFEPVKEFYEISLRNVELNPQLKDKINLFNYAVSYKSGTLTIDSMDSTQDYIGQKDSYEVEVLSIDNILEKFDIKPNLLKMDCEGCEFDIIRNTDLSYFDEIIMEHHAGFRDDNHQDIVDILKNQGFEVELVPLWMYDIEDLGIIHAYKD